MGPIWIKLIGTWSKPLTDVVLAHNVVQALLPILNQGQTWADNAFITSQSLTNDEEDKWDAVTKINNAHKLLWASNTLAPATSLAIVTAMNNNQTILALDLAQDGNTPEKRSPT